MQGSVLFCRYMPPSVYIQRVKLKYNQIIYNSSILTNILTIILFLRTEARRKRLEPAVIRPAVGGRAPTSPAGTLRESEHCREAPQLPGWELMRRDSKRTGDNQVGQLQSNLASARVRDINIMLCNQFDGKTLSERKPTTISKQCLVIPIFQYRKYEGRKYKISLSC